MNNTAKQCISDKLIKAMTEENLKANDVGKIFNFSPCYVSMMKKPKQWDKCSKHSWEAVQKWTNSGVTLLEYGTTYFPEPRLKIKHETQPEARAKVKPEAYQKRIAELKEQIELNTTTPENQKVVLDIEINLYINGKKLKLWD